jgi:hypothetical protein
MLRVLLAQSGYISTTYDMDMPPDPSLFKENCRLGVTSKYACLLLCVVLLAVDCTGVVQAALQLS